MNILTYLDFELIKLLYKENTLSQRAISKRLNCSLGKTNETIKNLKELEYINDDNSLTDLGIGQPSSVFLSRAMPRTRFYNRHPSCKAPFFIDLRKLVVQGKHIILKLQTVLSMENLLESKLAVLAM